uniref:Transposase n=1 Tax=uncultured bacterium psy1 TaxID=693111 RepID=D2SUE0_9BACT|nr:transposase [uncultured bacterium psy1]
MIHPMPTKVLLTTTFEPLVMQLSGLLARGVRLIDQFVQDEPTPPKMMAFAGELSSLLREVGRRIMGWALNRFESEADDEAPSRVEFERRLYRRRRRHPNSVATLFGPVKLRRRLCEPLGRGGRSIHPLELRLGIEAGLATPALAERVGRWSTDHTQHEVLALLEKDHGVHWSCSSLRKVLKNLRGGMTPHREVCQVDQVVEWIEQARASKGRFRPTLSVGRDGIFVPLRRGVAQEGATATVSVLDRQGKRLGTVYLGQMPESGQGALTDHLSALLRQILSRVDSQGIRLAYVTDEGHHPSTYCHQVLKKMSDPRRPWRRLEWLRIVDFYHACQYIQQLADTIFGAGPAAQSWAKQMRQVLKTKVDGVARVLKSASALRRQRGLCGEVKASTKAYGYIKKRTQWMRYHLYKRQKLPLGSGITEAGCKIVFTQRLKRSGMSWTIEGGQVILDLRVIKLSRVWNEVYQRYLVSKPMPIVLPESAKAPQNKRLAA